MGPRTPRPDGHAGRIQLASKLLNLGVANVTHQRQETSMADNPATAKGATDITREQLVGLLNEDLAREYQAIIAYVVYSQVLKGAQYMSIAEELETHASEELEHALIISKQIDYLGGTPTVTPKPVKVSDKAEDLLRLDLDNENE